jgi:hypothetical protein
MTKVQDLFLVDILQAEELEMSKLKMQSRYKGASSFLTDI